MRFHPLLNRTQWEWLDQVQALTLRLYVSLLWEGSATQVFLLSLPSEFDHSLQTLVLFPHRPPTNSVLSRVTEKEDSYFIIPVAKNYILFIS